MSDVVRRFCLLGLAGALLIASPTVRAATADPDIAACNDVKDWNARIAGCSRLLIRQKWPAKSMAQLYLQRAQGYVNLKQLQSALPDYEASVKLDPTNAVAFGERSYVYTQLGDADRGLQSADQALRLNPNYGLAYMARAFALTQRGQLDEAIDAIGKSIALNPNVPSNYIVRANAYAGKGDTDRALADLDRVIKLIPQDPAGYNNRCWVLTAKGDLDNALVDCNQALQLNPSHAVSYSNRGIIYFQKGDLDRALTDFGQAIRYSLRSSLLGWLHRPRRRLAEARRPRACARRLSGGDQNRPARRALLCVRRSGVRGTGPDRPGAGRLQDRGRPADHGRRNRHARCDRRIVSAASSDTARARLVAFGDAATMPAGPLYNRTPLATRLRNVACTAATARPPHCARDRQRRLPERAAADQSRQRRASDRERPARHGI